MSKKKDYTKIMELRTVILVSLIAIVTAWSAYQSTLWGGIQLFRIDDAQMASRHAAELNTQQAQYSLIDASMFFQYVDAVANDDKKLSDFYFERFRPDFKPAVQAWLDTNPFESPNSPPHPFFMNEYKRTFADEAEQLEKQAELMQDEAQQANYNSDNYILVTVICAALLLFANISDKFTLFRLDDICFLITVVSFSIVTFMVIFMMPITTPG